jgi:peptidoglycan hydrolase-like protein with peptidoglycan-binding domain
VPLLSGRLSSNARIQQAANSSPSLKQGEKSDAVAIVQQALVDLGFAMPLSTQGGRGLTDGIFGAETARIVRQFQKSFGLTVDGIVGKQTLAKLDELIVAQSKLKESQGLFAARQDFTLRTAKPSA